MSDISSIADKAEWLKDTKLQRLLALLSVDGDEARVVGGAVRNALLGETLGDIDIATTSVPEVTVSRAAAAGFKTVPTGISHGTVTVVIERTPFEVTTLRADTETDGRRATVAFGRDWKTDAERRDFTINGLYARADGTVIDLVGGLADIETRTVRFIGDAETRIREDYLRILRFFRFFAWYGHGRPDGDGLRASARLKDGLAQLSAERVWSELKKMLSAPDPSRALLWMRQAGVLTAVLPDTEKWGIDSIHALVRTQRDLEWIIDPMLRLISLLPPDPIRMEALSRSLKMSREERDRIIGWANTTPPRADMSERDFARLLYRSDITGMSDRLRLALAAARAEAIHDDAAMMRAGNYSRLLGVLEQWQKPQFPLTGGDLIAAGVEKGPDTGRAQRALEELWVDSNFSMTRDALLERLPGLNSKG